MINMQQNGNYIIYLALSRSKQYIVKKSLLSSSKRIPQGSIIYQTDSEQDWNDAFKEFKKIEQSYSEKFVNILVQLKNLQVHFATQIKSIQSEISTTALSVPEFFAEYRQKEESKPQSQNFFLTMTQESESALLECEDLIYNGISFIAENNENRGLVLALEGLKRYEQTLSTLNAHGKELAQLISTLSITINDNKALFFDMCKTTDTFQCIMKDLRAWREYMKNNPFTMETAHKIHEPTMSAIFQVIQELDVSHCEPSDNAGQDDDDLFFF